MAKEAHLHSDMANARQSEGINVIFDQESPASCNSRSRSRSSSGSRRSSPSSVKRRRASRREHKRSPSTSSRSSSPHSRSRSYPRCHRQSSRCRCDNHQRHGRGRRSPPRSYRSRSRSYRAHSRSLSRSPLSDRYSHHRSNWPKSSSRLSRRPANQPRITDSTSYRSQSRSRSSEKPVGLSLLEQKELLKTAKENATEMLGLEKLELPECVTPVLLEQTAESTHLSPELWTRSDDEDPDNMSSPSMSPKRKMISFSINNSLAKPTVAGAPGAKVTSKVDSYESRKPYGHWIPVKSGQTSRKRKHTLTKSH